ncbi:DUF6463 family protein [Actinomadura miaoliensis]|uniref:Uncharacterized protein n=1 Tax=Actinomadura miaoliensis TaxID=430685 RepID=A0ABP7W0N4_9ACTN
MITWAGRVIALLGTLHLLTSAFYSREHVPGWATGDLWFPGKGPEDLSPSAGAFWLTVGSFGLPLLLLGLLIIWMDRHRIVPPAFLAWTIGAWCTLGGLLLMPSPFLLAWVPAAMLLIAARRRARAETTP